VSHPSGSKKWQRTFQEIFWVNPLGLSLRVTELLRTRSTEIVADVERRDSSSSSPRDRSGPLNRAGDVLSWPWWRFPPISTMRRGVGRSLRLCRYQVRNDLTLSRHCATPRRADGGTLHRDTIVHANDCRHRDYSFRRPPEYPRSPLGPELDLFVGNRINLRISEPSRSRKQTAGRPHQIPERVCPKEKP
jgi:hypothetical protein